MAARKSQGFYTFADGTRIWFFGLSAQEKKIEVLKHGAIIKFEARMKHWKQVGRFNRQGEKSPCFLWRRRMPATPFLFWLNV